MFALSRDGERVFLHQPDAGMAVPVLLDLESRKLTVRVPSVYELENDYAIYDELGDVLGVVSRSHRDQVKFAGKFSQECSKAFRSQISTGDLTVAALRKLVEGRLRRASAARPEAIQAPVSTPPAALFSRSVRED